MRPMFFDFPQDEVCYTIKDQYMFGRDILFAPIFEQGSTERKVYLPQGEWVRTSTKETFKGGQWINVPAQIDEYIAFAVKGTAVCEMF